MSFELAVSFHDGKERSMRFKVSHIDGEQTTAEILSRIRKYEQSLHRNLESETILDSIITITIRDYHEVYEKLYGFISRIDERIEHLKSGKSEGYISTILTLNSMKLVFEKEE